MLFAMRRWMRFHRIGKRICVWYNEFMINSVLKDRRILVFLVIIVAIAAFLRLFMLGNNPFVADEFLDVNATYGHHKTDIWQAWDFNRGDVSVRINEASDKRASVYRSQVSALYSFFPPEEQYIRLVSALWGILTTLVIFGVTFSFTRNPWIALGASFLWAVSVPAIEQNRQIRMYSMFAPIFLLFSWSLFRFLESSRKTSTHIVQDAFNLGWLYLIPCAALGVLSFHLHPLTGNILFVVIIYCLVMTVFFHRLGQSLSRYLVYLLTALGVIVATAIALPAVYGMFSSLLVFFNDNFTYVNHIGATFWHPLLGWLLIMMGVYVSFRPLSRDVTQLTTEQKAGLWVSVNFLVILLFAIFLWRRNVGAQYIFFIQPFVMILVAIGLERIFRYLSDRGFFVSRTKSSLAFFSLIILLLPAWGYFFARNNTYHLKSDAQTPNYRKVFDYVKDEAREGDVMITRNVRNFYYNGLDIPVFDFGSERGEAALAAEGKFAKITLPVLQKIIQDNPTGWIVYSDNDEDFITTEARDYMLKDLDRVTDSPRVRGAIFVYRW